MFNANWLLGEFSRYKPRKKNQQIPTPLMIQDIGICWFLN
ncbi:hypothetical protein N644_1365 [Lactiplantibacillus paraplantarum]|nr:hypothetical protein N644_1365 [Lactiplantibacillus paraplantarum]